MFRQNGKFGQNGKLGHSCTNVTKGKLYGSQDSDHAIVHLGLNVSNSILGLHLGRGMVSSVRMVSLVRMVSYRSLMYQRDKGQALWLPGQ